jgi:chromosome segregation ATPase
LQIEFRDLKEKFDTIAAQLSEASRKLAQQEELVVQARADLSRCTSDRDVAQRRLQDETEQMRLNTQALSAAESKLSAMENRLAFHPMAPLLATGKMANQESSCGRASSASSSWPMEEECESEELSPSRDEVEAEVKVLQAARDDAEKKKRDSETKLGEVQSEFNELERRVGEGQRLLQEREQQLETSQLNYSQLKEQFDEQTKALEQKTAILKKCLNTLISFNSVKFDTIATTNNLVLLCPPPPDADSSTMVFKGKYMHGPVAIKVTYQCLPLPFIDS